MTECPHAGILIVDDAPENRLVQNKLLQPHDRVVAVVRSDGFGEFSNTATAIRL